MSHGPPLFLDKKKTMKQDKSDQLDQIIRSDTTYQVPRFRGSTQVYDVPVFTVSSPFVSSLPKDFKFVWTSKDKSKSGDPGAMTLVTDLYRDKKTKQKAWTALESIHFRPNWTLKHVAQDEFDPLFVVVHSSNLDMGAKKITAHLDETSIVSDWGMPVPLDDRRKEVGKVWELFSISTKSSSFPKQAKIVC